MKIKENISISECFKVLKIRCEGKGFFIWCVISAVVLYGIFSLFYWVIVNWTIDNDGASFYILVGASAIFLLISVLCGKGREISAYLKTQEITDYDECADRLVIKKIFKTHYFLYAFIAIMLLIIGLFLEAFPIIWYLLYKSYLLQVSICICLAPSVIGIGTFMFAMINACKIEARRVFGNKNCTGKFYPYFCEKCGYYNSYRSSGTSIHNFRTHLNDYADYTVGTVSAGGISANITQRDYFTTTRIDCVSSSTEVCQICGHTCEKITNVTYDYK